MYAVSIEGDARRDPKGRWFSVAEGIPTPYFESAVGMKVMSNSYPKNKYTPL
jgi:hypothetical protein